MKLKKVEGLEILTEEVLCCPHCGCDYTHQGEVTVFNREEDAEKVSTVIVSKNGNLTSKMTNGEGNPSSRRNGLLIKFECEGCQQSFYVGVSQHKGQTFFEYFVKK